MDGLGSAGFVLANLSRSQFDERKIVSALASGLRIQSAADDPSGLAIAETINTKVSGLQQGVQNVQSANNLLQVADSTLASVQSILQRIHSLIVESRSDFESRGQLKSIQTEIDGLLQEINKISGDANFNGVHLFNGSLDTSAPPQPSLTIVTSEPNSDGSISSQTVANADGAGNPGPLIAAQPLGPIDSIQALLEFRVTGYSDNAVDPDSGTAVGPGVYVTFTAYSNDPNFGAGQQMIDTVAVPINSGPITGIATPSPSGGGVLLQYDLANLTKADVGKAITIVTTIPPPAAPQGHALDVNYGGSEGSTIAISLPTVSATALNVSGITVLPPTVVNFNNVVTGTSSSNQFAADDAQIRVQSAIDAVSTIRATVGAQSVALSETSNDSSVQIVNQVAAESAIRDLNVGQATTQFTRDQILSRVGQSVLAQMQTSALQVASLLVHAI
ncbi:MAG TPA: flagellin [Candidatus Baltobacteraceae bacterium]|jgi:flagellin